jgi:hypothetical protein
MWRRGLSLLVFGILGFGVLWGAGAALAHGVVGAEVADGVRGVQPTNWRP